jgi:hypothetical protein
MAQRIWTAEHFEGSDVTFLDRVVRPGGVAIVPGDVTSWTLRVFERSDDRSGRRIVDAAAAAGYVFSTLSTTDWQKDTTGWNFKYVLPYATFKHRALTYRFEFSFETASYGRLYSVHQIKFLPMGSA